MEIISEKITIKDLLVLRRSNMLTVNPEYQRGAVWSEAQQKRLVDSVMRSYPLPLIYLHYKKVSVAGLSRESLEIIDGQQRIDALYAFAEKGIKLFDPVKDDKKARFPDFIKNIPCPWAQCDYLGLSDELRRKFDDTEIFVVKVTTEKEDEARDLFIRLQAGLPLTPQEKRDAWPGGYTEFTLRFGGKYKIDRYPGHEFFRKLVISKSTDRGDLRTLCAQLGMLFFENATEGNWLEIGTQAIDDYYYQNLGFDINAPRVARFSKVLDIAVNIFAGYNGKKLKVHEAIHIVLLINSLIDDYTREWQHKFIEAFDNFRHNALIVKKQKEGEYWFKYISLTIAQAAQASSLQRRHSFFVEKMTEILKPVRKDDTRIYGQLEREMIFYRDGKTCAVCGYEVNWQDMEIHHVDEHQRGGKTSLENGVPVHKQCHPKGQAAVDFYEKWLIKKETLTPSDASQTSTQVENTNSPTVASGNATRYKIENANKGVLAYAIITETGKFCILKGSTISRMVTDSFDLTAKAASVRRANLIEDGSINDDFVFTRDVVFNSKSNAASLVLGFSANGNISWMPELE
ncbi:MAG: DUF4357 domain-containing protein [Chitinophagaceae bacterium]|nr:DUF4357 domain-containing protein [Chitinophagaceae bacterium]